MPAFLTYAQRDILNRAGRTLGNKVANKTIDKGTDIAAEKIVDAIFKNLMKGKKVEDSVASPEGNESKTESKKRKGPGLGALMGGAPAEKVDKQFTFDYEIVLKMTGEQGSNSIIQLVPENGGYMGMEISSIKIITDFEDDESYTIINDQLSSMNMSKHTENSALDPKYDPEKNKVTATDDYKDIAGYRSRRYHSESEDGNSDIWMTTVFIKNPYLNKEQRGELGDHAYANGFPMLIDFTDEKGEKSSLEVVQITKKKQTIDLSEL